MMINSFFTIYKYTHALEASVCQGIPGMLPRSAHDAIQLGQLWSLSSLVSR